MRQNTHSRFSRFALSLLVFTLLLDRSAEAVDRFFFEADPLAEGSTGNSLRLRLEHDQSLIAYSSRFLFDPARVMIQSGTEFGTDFEDAFFFSAEVDPVAGVVICSGVLNLTEPGNLLPAGTSTCAEFVVDVTGQENQSAVFDLQDTPGSLPQGRLQNLYYDGSNQLVLPVLQDATFSIGPPEGGGDEPDIAALPPGLVFGALLPGETSTDTITLRNDGVVPLTISVLELSPATDAEFELLSPPGTPLLLGPAQSTNLQVRFSPTGAGDFSGTVEVSSDDPDSPLLLLPILGTGLEALEPDLGVSPTSYDFGSRLVGEPRHRIFTITNTGNQELRVDALTITGSPDFTVIRSAQDPNPLSLPLLVSPGGNTPFTVRYLSGDTGPDSAVLAIESDDPDSPVTPVPLSATAVAAPAPAISVTPPEHDFGAEPLGQRLAQIFTIRNEGQEDLVIESLERSGSGDFAIASSRTATDPPPLPETVRPDRSFTFAVLYDGCRPGTDSGTVTVRSNDPARPTVQIQLTARRTALEFEGEVGYDVVQDVFARECFGCHQGPTFNGNLDLGVATSYANLVGTPSLLLDALLVVPGEVDASFLFEKIICASPSVGTSMPITEILDPEDQQSIHDWILSGAPAPRLPRQRFLELRLDCNLDDELGNTPATNINPLECADDRFGQPDSSYRFTGGQLISEVVGNERGRLPVTGGDFTLDLWVRSDPGGGQDSFQTVFEIGHAASLGIAPRLAINFNTAQQVLRLRRGGQASLFSAPARRDRWHHVLVTRVNGQLAFHVDGLRVGQVADGDPVGGAYAVGGDSNQGNRFRGRIDHVRYAAGGLEGAAVDELLEGGPTAYLHPVAARVPRVARPGNSVEDLVLPISTSTSLRPLALRLEVTDRSGGGVSGFGYLENPRLIYRPEAGAEETVGIFTRQSISDRREDWILDPRPTFSTPGASSGALFVRFTVSPLAPRGREFDIGLAGPDDLEFETTDEQTAHLASAWGNSEPVLSGARFTIVDEAEPVVELEFEPAPESLEVNTPAEDVELHRLTLTGEPGRTLRVDRIRYAVDEGADLSRLDQPRLFADLDGDGLLEPSESIEPAQLEILAGVIIFLPPPSWTVPPGGSIDLVLVSDISGSGSTTNSALPLALPRGPGGGWLLLTVLSLLAALCLLALPGLRLRSGTTGLLPGRSLRLAASLLLLIGWGTLDLSCRNSSSGGGGSTTPPATPPTDTSRVQMGIDDPDDLRLSETSTGFSVLLSGFPPEGIPGPDITLVD